MAGIGCVIFDLDGTLHDSAAGITKAMNEILDGDCLDPIPVDVMTKFIGDNPDSIVPKAYKHQGFNFVPYEANPRQQSFAKKLESVTATPDDLYPGVVDTLTALRERGVAIAICTNGFRDATLNALAGLGLAPLVDAVVCGASQSVGKPDPGPVRDAVERARAARPSDGPLNLLVGDRKDDIKAGKAAECQTVAVTYGYGDGSPDTWGADAVINSIHDLPAWIDARS